jgi:2-polyprenyl-6-methoxyphenol hydroxylase-like FAD-dependent oxidoreductase
VDEESAAPSGGRFDADVAVIGYGPVGMVMAALLGQAGHRVVVLERYPGLYNLPRAASFDDETMRTLARLGVADRLLPGLRVQPTYEWRNGAGNLLIEQRFAARGRSGWAEWYLMYQPDLETTLDEVCRSLEAVEVRLAAPVVAIEQDDETVRLTVEPAVGPRVIRVRYAVACDGGNSFVRRALGVGQDDYGFSEPWMVCDFRLTRPVEVPGALQFGDPAGPTSIIALGLRHQRFSFMLDSVGDFPAESVPAKVWARAGRWLQREDAELIRVATYTFRSLVAHSWRIGRVLLAGDAAHQMPPFLGQGMCSGIRDAADIAFKLDLVLRGRRRAEVLDTVQTEREPHVRAVIEEGVRLGRLQTMRDPERAQARDRELLARRAAAGPSRRTPFPDLTTGFMAERSGRGRGALSAQGRVDAGQGPRLLDAVAGGGTHLIVQAAILPAIEAAALLPALEAAGVHVIALAEALHPGQDSRVVADVDGTYARWFAELGAVAVAVRPDLYVYGTADGEAAAVGLARELLTALGVSSPVAASATAFP